MALPLLKLFGGNKGDVGKAAVKGISQIATQIATSKSVQPPIPGDADIVDGRLVEDITVSGSTTVPHTLGRVPSGALVVKSDTSGKALRIDTFTSTSFEAQAASGSVVVSFWVF